MLVGADGKIKSTGYCGAPVGQPNCCDTGVCGRADSPPGQGYEYCVSVHAEMNAMLQATPEEMKGATLYVSGFNIKTGEEVTSKPCTLCERMIRNAGIARVTYKHKGSINGIRHDKYVDGVRKDFMNH